MTDRYEGWTQLTSSPWVGRHWENDESMNQGRLDFKKLGQWLPLPRQGANKSHTHFRLISHIKGEKYPYLKQHMILSLKSCLISSVGEEKFVHSVCGQTTQLLPATLKFPVIRLNNKANDILYLSNLNGKTAAQDFTQTWVQSHFELVKGKEWQN